jgi:hypothetical protein
VSALHVALAALFALNTVATVMLVGREREPITERQAVIVAFVNAVLIALLLVEA